MSEAAIPYRAIRSLAHWSCCLGKDPLLAQAGGGNISVKLSEGRMIVKASGIRLREVSVRRGWVPADFGVIRQNLLSLQKLSSASKREMAYADLIKTSTLRQGVRGSMEMGFHAILSPRWVVHTHSVAGIIIGMCPFPKMKRKIQQILGGRAEVHEVPACVPGFQLSLAMHQRVTEIKSNVHLWLLRNHGLVWSGNSRRALQQAMDRFEDKLRHHFSLSRYSAPHSAGSAGCRIRKQAKSGLSAFSVTAHLCFCHWPECRISLAPVFPDFVIYFDVRDKRVYDALKTSSCSVQIGARDYQELKDKQDVLFAHVLVHTLGVHYQCLRLMPHSIVRVLKQLEVEKKRIAQARSQ